MATVKQGLEPMSPTDVANYGENVVAGMTGNASFPAPNPALSVISGLASDIRQNLTDIKDLENQLAALRGTLHDNTDKIKGALGNEGNYVQTCANDAEASGGDAVAVIKSANMGVREEAKPIGELPAPEKASIADGHDDGALEAHCSKVRGAGSYLWQTCVGDNPITGAWGGDRVSTKTSITLTGYTLGSRVWMRVAGIGAAGNGDWSQPVSDIVT